VDGMEHAARHQESSGEVGAGWPRSLAIKMVLTMSRLRFARPLQKSGLPFRQAASPIGSEKRWATRSNS
jgi:hypothetical protein